jgi:hypothetical protein
MTFEHIMTQKSMSLVYASINFPFMAVGTPKGFQQLWARIMGTDLRKGDPWPVLC